MSPTQAHSNTRRRAEQDAVLLRFKQNQTCYACKRNAGACSIDDIRGILTVSQLQNPSVLVDFRDDSSTISRAKFDTNKSDGRTLGAGTES